ncbi:MAG: aspartate-semialdehyde dehydrogenase [Chlamydiia bacterium]|nr:aspartate-semialdehyde dehydrogenase [Chlamydiia bacterium]
MNAICILGASGLVGQKAIALIDHLPNFEVTEVVASENRLGLTYEESVDWQEPRLLPNSVAKLKFKEPCEVTSPFVISSLPSSVASKIEPLLAQKGKHVFTNSSCFRLDPNVPLVIPEINQDQLKIVTRQPTPGKVVANPNCSATFIALALAPLLKLSSISYVSVVTCQAISGAGLNGLSAYQILGNIIPYIQDEEEKIALELAKILNIDTRFIVHTTRVPVINGHTIMLHIHFDKKLHLENVKELYQNLSHVRLYEQKDRPQVFRDIGPYDDRVHIGRLKLVDRVLGMVVMGNNLTRGAASAAIRNLLTFVGDRSCASSQLSSRLF